MKLRKGIVACVLAATVVAASAMSVMAAGSASKTATAVGSVTKYAVAVGSVTKNGVAVGSVTKNAVAVGSVTKNGVAVGSISKDGKAGNYKVEVVSANSAIYTQLKADQPAVAEAVVAVNDGKMTMKEFIEELKKDSVAVADKLDGTEFVSGFYSLTPDASTQKGEDGKYKVTLTVQNLTKDLTGIKVLAYNATTKEWEVVEIPADDIDVANHTITVSLEDVSLFAVISDAK